MNRRKKSRPGQNKNTTLKSFIHQSTEKNVIKKNKEKKTMRRLWPRSWIQCDGAIFIHLFVWYEKRIIHTYYSNYFVTLWPNIRKTLSLSSTCFIIIIHPYGFYCFFFVSYSEQLDHNYSREKITILLTYHHYR